MVRPRRPGHRRLGPEQVLPAVDGHVAQPQGIDFATDRSVRVAENGSVRAFADRRSTTCSPSSIAGPRSSALDVGPSGSMWAVAATGEFARVPDTANVKPTWLGTPPEGRPQHDRDRRAERRDARDPEGTSPNQTRPADGTVARYDATGKLLAAWPIPRPAGGEPSIPAGLAATATAASGSPTPTTAACCAGRRRHDRPDARHARHRRRPARRSARPGVDCAGGLLVADSGNNRIVRFAGVAPARSARRPPRRPPPAARPRPSACAPRPRIAPSARPPGSARSPRPAGAPAPCATSRAWAASSPAVRSRASRST